MEKIFLTILVFGFAIVAAAPSIENSAKPSQCEVNKEVALNLANFIDRMAKGQGK